MPSNNSELEATVKFLQDNTIFAELSRPVLRSIAAKLQELSFARTETIVTEGDSGDSFYMIREGHVQAVHINGDGEMFVLSEMNPGEGFGELALLTKQPRSCTIIARDCVKVLRLDYHDFETLYSTYPEIALRFEELRKNRVSLLEDESQSTFAISKFSANRRLQGSLDYTIISMLTKLNEATGGPEQLEHCQETGQLAQEMSKILCPMVSDELLFAGYLHEIGKISIPRDLIIRERTGQELTESERATFNGLYTASASILKPHKLIYERLGFISDLDAKEYRDMRLEAQILKVANDFMELRSMHYRNLSDDEALECISAHSGTIYNPRAVTALITNINQFKNIRKEAQLNMVRMMVKALDRKDNYTYRHSVHVSQVTSILCKRLHMSDAETRLAEIAAELHDAGKIFIDESILNAPRQLTDKEYAIMKSHAKRSADFFADVYGMDKLAAIIGAHHEKYDGTGYPQGLAGEEIPFIARIMAIADVWSALTTPRVYRGNTSMPPGKALSIMEENCAKGDFDPDIFAEFRSYIQENMPNLEANFQSRDLPR